eukprot:CAMPEP_0114519890 /NCGR_PEP_ID=MMETSP0109-20121206/19263_1 /TAXON_ID=29199 /ORGANISM="Chlorarachnion reptans, Strain CCCM449" /LENGTH=91 /DNA_ID=CAMNT_0001700697 /DNA_START=109 /DNA_END=380 /DNA_ORIENTATION=+
MATVATSTSSALGAGAASTTLPASTWIPAARPSRRVSSPTAVLIVVASIASSTGAASVAAAGPTTCAAIAASSKATSATVASPATAIAAVA